MVNLKMKKILSFLLLLSLQGNSQFARYEVKSGDAITYDSLYISGNRMYVIYGNHIDLFNERMLELKDGKIYHYWICRKENIAFVQEMPEGCNTYVLNGDTARAEGETVRGSNVYFKAMYLMGWKVFPEICLPLFYVINGKLITGSCSDFNGKVTNTKLVEWVDRAFDFKISVPTESYSIERIAEIYGTERQN